jgi:hypothetical protein
MTARFDIFRGSLDLPVWVEEARTEEAAKDHLSGIAQKSRPDDTSFLTHEVMYSTDTTPSLRRMESPLSTSQTA